MPRRPGFWLFFRHLLPLVALCAAFGPTPAWGAWPEPPSEERIWFEPAPKITVLTFGPGDAAFLKFGHNAIRVAYPGDGPDLVYNFGTFRFDSPFLILDFLTGKFQYWLSVAPYRAVVQHYAQANRDVIEQVLNISNPKAWQVAGALRENALPENRYYVYDYYRDNCSTRVRDTINQAVGGVLEERSQARGSLTLREHTLRLVADDLWLYLGLDIAMGPYIDQPETRWGEMFIPAKVEEALGAIVFTGVHGTSSLVKKREVLNTAKGRPRARNNPPERTLGFMQAGVFGGALMAFLGWETHHRRKRWARTSLALSIGLFGLVTGTLGLLFCSLWAFTDHQVTYYNENILQCAPWAVLLAGCAWGIHQGKLETTRFAYRVAMVALAASAAGLAAKFMPFFMNQHNERIIALFLPLWIGAFTALRFSTLRAERMLTVPVVDTAAAEQDDPLPEDREEEERPKPSTRPPPAPDDESDEQKEEAPTPSGQPAPA